MLLILETRFNIDFAITVVSQFAKISSHQNIEAMKIIFCYLKATKSIGVTKKRKDREDHIIKVHSESNWV